ncbi:MAG: hypothetical protein ACSHYF_03980 [Verrucomicrobiaceae bacterium]
MKLSLPVSLLLLAVPHVSFAKDEVVVADDKAYVLYQENHVLPAGTVLERSLSNTVKDGKLKISMQGEMMDGGMTMETTESDKLESLEGGKYRYTLVSSDESQQMTLMGQPMPANAKVNVMVGKAVVLSKVEGKWVGKLEEGEATIEQNAEIVKIQTRLNEDPSAKLYGTAPRKVGDEWESDAAGMMGLEDFNGKVKTKFVKIEKFQGVACAVLHSTIELNGTVDEMEEMTMSLTGTVDSRRSLKDLEDLSFEMKGTMKMNGAMEPQPGLAVKMEMTGPMAMTGKATLTRP